MTEYSPKSIEPKWQQYWEEHKSFKTGEVSDVDQKSYILDMFPYPSGSGLHIGHPVGYTGSDIFARFQRHRGFKVLHTMGYDSFGLPAEQHALATGEHPAALTKVNCERFTGQLKALGYSFDWDREIRTSDPSYYKWTQWIFLKLYNSYFCPELGKALPISDLPIPAEVEAEGELAIEVYRSQHRLAYMDEALVNWCPALGTVLANEEVIDGRSERGGHDVIRKPMRQWFMRITAYAERLLSELEAVDWPESIKEQQRHWIGKRRGTNVIFKVDGSEHTLTTFTTRPDTQFGVTFVVLSPEHGLVDELTTDEHKAEVEAYKEKASRLSDLDRTIENKEKTGVFTGSYVINPVNGAKVPLYVGDYVLMSVGTGAVMGVPAHDDRDFVFAKKYDVPIIPVLAPAEDHEDYAAVVNGEKCWTAPGTMLDVNRSETAGLALSGIPGADNETTKVTITEWLAANGHGEAVVNYRLRDWLFSRQRYWGEPIPLIHWEDGTCTTVPEEELPLTLPPTDDFKPAETGESPLARVTEWVNVTCEKTGRKGRRETNTMPQWAGSCWYYLRFIDPHNDEAAWDPKKENRWMPIDLYIGGAEHAVLHLLYARFWHKVLFDLELVSTPEPFQKLFNQGMLVSHAYKDARGALVPVDEVEEREDGSAIKTATGEPVERIQAKMSKSLRNVVSPEEIIDEYGADTLRTYLMFMAPLEALKPWSSEAIVGTFRFLKRSWTLVTDNQEEGVRPFIEDVEQSADVLRAVHGAIKKVTEDIDNLRLNTAIAALMELINQLSNQPISKETAEAFTVMISPFAPHLAEELWQRLGHSSSISAVSWPTYNEEYLKVSSVTVVVQVLGKKRSTLETPIEIAESELSAMVVEAMAGSKYPVSADDRFIVVRDKKSGAPKLVNVIPKKK